jgi:hypothetical protein
MVPDTVAKAIVAALLNGTEDVFPDFMAQAIHDEWKVDAKRLEEHMAT